MSTLEKREYPFWYLESVGLEQITKWNWLLSWIYTLYFNKVILPKSSHYDELKNRRFSCMYTEVLLHDKKNSTRSVYLLLFYVRTSRASFVFWNVSPTIWPFDTENNWTCKKRAQDSEILSIITDVVRYARESTESIFFNRLKYVQRKSKRLSIWPIRFLKACNDFF